MGVKNKYEEFNHFIYRIITQFTKTYLNQLVSYNTQVLHVNGTKTLNITNNIPNKTINIYKYYMKTTLVFENFKIIINFTGTDCSLSYVIIFNKDIDKYHYSFFELTNVIGKDDFKKYNSLWLYDEEKLKIAFDWLFAGIDKYFQSIGKLSINESMLSELKLNLEHDNNIINKYSKSDFKLQNEGYELFCKNKYKKAIINYENLNDNLQFMTKDY